MIEFIDCGSLSISFDATGKASVSMTVLRDDSESIDFDSYNNGTWGGTHFDLVTLAASQKPIVGGGWYEWNVQLEGVGN